MNEDRGKQSPGESGNTGSGSSRSQPAGLGNPQEGSPATVPSREGPERREVSPGDSAPLLQEAADPEEQTVLCFRADLPPGVRFGAPAALAQGTECSGREPDGAPQTQTVIFQCSGLPDGVCFR